MILFFYKQDVPNSGENEFCFFLAAAHVRKIFIGAERAPKINGAIGEKTGLPDFHERRQNGT